jgi:hypothetical protein
MFHRPISVTIKAGSQTQLLVRQGPDEVLIARLGPPDWADRRALPELLESLARWFQCRLHVVLSVASEETASSLGLADGLGCGHSTLHYEVDVVLPRDRRRAVRLRGLGSLRALRREAARGADR